MNAPLRILFIGGDEEEYGLAGIVLRKSFPEVEMERATSAGEFAEALVRAEFNLVFTEHELGWGTGLSLLAALRSRIPTAPVVMFTQSGSEEVAADAMGAGVDVYLPKSPRNFMRLGEVVGSLLARPEPSRGSEASDSRLLSLLGRAKIGSFRSTLEGRLLSANAAFLEMTGIDRLEAIEDLNLQGLDERPGDWAERARRLKREGHLYEEAVALRRIDGPTIWVSLSLSLDISPLGESAIDGFLVDVTGPRELERTFQEKVRELARSNSDLEQFAHTASHELQEPLRTVERYTQLLGEEAGAKLKGEAKESLEFILDGVRRMRRLVEDLLCYSRVVTASRPLKDVDCEALFGQTLGNLKAAIEESRALISHDKLPTLTADSGQLLSIFQNLIGNAIKFRNCRVPEIHVSAERNKGEWIFSVRDNGIGFDPKQRDRIFGIFQRLHTEAEYPGTGVGLAVCKRIIERHAGRIWAESEPGKGATFFFTIPDKSPEPDTSANPA